MCTYVYVYVYTWMFIQLHPLIHANDRDPRAVFDLLRSTRQILVCTLICGSSSSSMLCSSFHGEYRGTSLERSNAPLGPYSRIMPMALLWS